MTNILRGLSSLFWNAIGALAPGTLLAIRIVASLASRVLVMDALRRMRILAPGQAGWRLARENLQQKPADPR